jgi:hypothetical protein
MALGGLTRNGLIEALRGAVSAASQQSLGDCGVARARKAGMNSGPGA